MADREERAGDGRAGSIMGTRDRWPGTAIDPRGNGPQRTVGVSHGERDAHGWAEAPPAPGRVGRRQLHADLRGERIP